MLMLAMFGNGKGLLTTALLVAGLGVAGLSWPPAFNLKAQAPESVQAAADRMTYNVGEEVQLRVVPPASELRRTNYLYIVRYAGEEKHLVEVSGGGDRGQAAANSSAHYRLLWKVPADARAGRYEVDLRVLDAASNEIVQDIPHIRSFVVTRQVVRIISAKVDQSYYTSGDAIGCNVRIENRSDRPLEGLRLEFSERYWPWIAQQRDRIGTDIEKLQNGIGLKPHEAISIIEPHCAVAQNVDRPTIKQYSAVVWDAARQNVYAIAITPLVFVNPPGVNAPQPYPGQYLYPGLDAVNTSTYREFHPEAYGADAIKFDNHHTMYPSGAEIPVRFSLTNPTDTAWRQVSVRMRLLGPDGTPLADHEVSPSLDLPPHGAALAEEAKFQVPPDATGLYRARVEVTESSGQLLATNDLELGINPLPKSVVLFCAHEDDDGAQMGFIRALVENQVPLHVVYFTSGDAGACDRYYEHSCGPTEALNFGALRMDEARAALGHLGVPRESILFLGLPDGGSGKIWYYHVQPSDPYLSIQLASDHAPYAGLFRPNLAFARESVVGAAAEIIKEFQPDVIFTAHPPAEGHIDHIVCNYFAVKALQELIRQGAVSPAIEVRVDRIFDARNHPATPYHYEDHNFHLSGEAMALAQEAGWYYQSQGGNRGEANLHPWNKLRRSEGYRKVLDWKEHEGWNEKE
jgi:LmbE family N-acetylglucosaminyl deacetylase